MHRIDVLENNALVLRGNLRAARAMGRQYKGMIGTLRERLQQSEREREYLLLYANQLTAELSQRGIDVPPRVIGR